MTSVMGTGEVRRAYRNGIWTGFASATVVFGFTVWWLQISVFAPHLTEAEIHRIAALIHNHHVQMPAGHPQ